MAQARRIALAGGEYYSWRMQLCCIRLNSSSRKPSELSVTDISHASNPGHSRCLCARVRAPQSRARRDSLWEPQPPNAAHGGAAHQHINADGPGPHERRTSERPHLHKNFYGHHDLFEFGKAMSLRATASWCPSPRTTTLSCRTSSTPVGLIT